jgi:hypothetical protein
MLTRVRSLRALSLKPMLALLGDRLRVGPDWSYEVISNDVGGVKETPFPFRPPEPALMSR